MTGQEERKSVRDVLEKIRSVTLNRFLKKVLAIREIRKFQIELTAETIYNIL
jgi:hypothetical protein